MSWKKKRVLTRFFSLDSKAYFGDFGGIKPQIFRVKSVPFLAKKNVYSTRFFQLIFSPTFIFLTDVL